MTGYEKDFQQRSYSIWAMKELYGRLKSNPKKLPDAILEDFSADLDFFACLNPHTSYIFSVAFDTVCWFHAIYLGEAPFMDDYKSIND